MIQTHQLASADVPVLDNISEGRAGGDQGLGTKIFLAHVLLVGRSRITGEQCHPQELSKVNKLLIHQST